MNVTPINYRTCNSKNQTNSPNFKATIVSELGKDFSHRDRNKYGLWLRNLILANLPVSNPRDYQMTYDGNKVLAPIEESLSEQALNLVNRLKTHFYERGIRFEEVTIERDHRDIYEIITPR